jgi:hypothetical protein
MSVTRRPLVLSALALIGVGIAGGIAVEAPRLLRKRIHSPYDDITNQISDQEQAVKVGDAVIAKLGTFDVAKSANALRVRKGSLMDMAKADIAAGKTLEARGWVLPESLALACAILADQTRRVG